MPKLGKSTFDILRPIGSYYETSDINFNPNTASGWYGTWVEDTEGQTLVSRDSGTFKTVGDNIGEEKHKLTIEEMPKHNFAIRVAVHNGGDAGNWRSAFATNSDWWGGGNHYDGNNCTNYVGEDKPHNIIQPSKVAIRWHRIA